VSRGQRNGSPRPIISALTKHIDNDDDDDDDNNNNNNNNNSLLSTQELQLTLARRLV
jgi:hypothetical protein